MKNLFLLLTTTVISLGFDDVVAVIGGYVGILGIIFIAFLNIYSVDKLEFLYNDQQCFEFKHKIIYIIQKSKHKHIVSKKTYILEVVGYLLAIIAIVCAIIGLFFDLKICLILVAINFVNASVFGGVTGSFWRKAQSKYRWW